MTMIQLCACILKSFEYELRVLINCLRVCVQERMSLTRRSPIRMRFSPRMALVAAMPARFRARQIRALQFQSMQIRAMLLGRSRCCQARSVPFLHKPYTARQNLARYSPNAFFRDRDGNAEFTKISYGRRLASE